MTTRDDRWILVSDDQESVRELLTIVLEGEGYGVLQASDGREALAVFRENAHRLDLIIQDLKMPEMDGVTLLRHYTQEAPEVPVIIITAFSSWDNAVEAMRLGAYDYIRKPFDTEGIRLVVNRAVERRQATDGGKSGDGPSGPRGMIGNHPSIQQVIRMVRRIAPTDSTVLIQGESGTGKELVARAVHDRSQRRNEAFVSVNCSAFTESLLESELFGHVRGAFTGAVGDKLGFFEAASGGTLFLDEVADMSLKTQVKILRVLEERKVCMVGSTENRPVDVRIIAATNKDMLTEVAEGRFREDLYYRLNVIPLWLTPLRDRKDDIPLLAGFFLARYARQMSKDVVAISAAARDALYRYHWPGNVRELENMIQRQVALCESDVIERLELGEPNGPKNAAATADNTEEILIPESGVDLEEQLVAVEKRYLREALKITDGNLTNAARLLGMSYRSMRYRVKKLRVREEELA